MYHLAPQISDEERKKPKKHVIKTMLIRYRNNISELFTVLGKICTRITWNGIHVIILGGDCGRISGRFYSLLKYFA